MLESLLKITNDGTIDTRDTVVCLIFSIVLGMIIAAAYAFISRRRDRSLSLFMTLIIIPAIVGLLITVIGSNTARAISIGGVFALTRFRSAQAEGKEISLVLLAMAAGLTSALGLLTVAFTATVLISLVVILVSEFSECVLADKGRELKIVIPENMDYTDAFTDLFEKYHVKARLDKVKTTNLGSLYELTYNVIMKNTDEKKFLDDIRVRNGNLNITLARPVKKEQNL